MSKRSVNSCGATTWTSFTSPPRRSFTSRRRWRHAIEWCVHATVRYGDAALVNFYHGFHQAGRMDRQELRLVFERGDVTLSDWVPTRARIHALVDERQTRELCDLVLGARLDVVASYGGTDRVCRGRGEELDAYQIIDLSFGAGQAKSPLSGQLPRSVT